MKPADIKKKIKKMMIRNSAIIAVLGGVFVATYFFHSAEQDNLKKVKKQIATTSQEIENIKSEYDTSEKKLQEYMLISALQLPTSDGYALSRDRLKAILPEIQSLKTVYLFKKLNTSFSEIVELPEAQSQFITAYKNDVTIEFSGATDEYIFSFISDLKNSLPGYTNIKRLNVDRIQDIDATSVSDYLSSDAGNGFVSGKLELTWITFKNKSENQPPEEAK